jgi:hypothetical protein
MRVIEATLMDRRGPLVLDCLDAEQAPFSKGTLVAFRKRLIEAQMDRRLIEQTIELANSTQEAGPTSFARGLGQQSAVGSRQSRRHDQPDRACAQKTHGRGGRAAGERTG